MNLRSIGAPTTAAAKKRLDFAYAYGGYRKPVFPVTEQEHHNSVKQLVRAAAKTKALQKVQELLAFGMCDQQPETDSQTPRTPQEATVERSEED